MKPLPASRTAQTRRQLLLACLYGGCLFPSSSIAQKGAAAIDNDADMARAVAAYMNFYPIIAMEAFWRGNIRAGAVANRIFLYGVASPLRLAQTADSDAPSASLLLDLSSGPFIVDFPPGRFHGNAQDFTGRWLTDLGLSGPDLDRGGRYLFVPPGYKAGLPTGFFMILASTNRLLLHLHAMPSEATVRNPFAAIGIRPLRPRVNWKEVQWLDASDGDFTPIQWEIGFDFWQILHETIDLDQPTDDLRSAYASLTALGLIRDQPFNPGPRLRSILERAAVTALAQMRVRAFGKLSERRVWRPRSWQWMAQARSFYRTEAAPPVMANYKSGEPVIAWLAAQDAAEDFLEGGKSYALTLPLPVPAQAWSVTIYDAETRSQISTDQGFAALRSHIEMRGSESLPKAELQFGPQSPKAGRHLWIRTIPTKGWFAMLRLYIPEAAAFDGRWMPGDFTRRPPAP